MSTLGGLTLLSDPVEASVLFTHLLCQESETALSSDLGYHGNDLKGACFPKHEHTAALCLKERNQ